jgi:hypothetical protein
MHIDQYRFGTLVVDGREIHGDVLVTPGYGRMRPAAGLERELAARGVAVELLSTADAVERINALLQAGAVGWAGALHLTC